MNADPEAVKAIFLEAVERHAPDQWPAFLDRACAGQPELRGRVEALLSAHREVGTVPDRDLPERADAGPVATAPEPAMREQPGAVIGPYKLLEPIGDGGMGVVYLAEQAQPVRRKVALKLIKPGMDTRQVIARFEVERQALALMDHPNIAKVLDAGATDTGRPYFVMELVKGLPITRYCDERRLSVRERLELFMAVCQAVQHAHQKGVIHRDLKPSNVLVAPYDGVPVVKVIDFGVAKAAGQPLTERTLATGIGAVVGTLEYMSPEQAELNNLDIDTRSDIYALGVLLYELLTGTTPFPKKRLEAAAFAEVLRMIREEEPPRPSTRLSTTEELPSIAANRGAEPAKLSGMVRGELDWIAMKALDKDRTRRYETADGLAMDVHRYLADEPVQACPPSAGYRFRKFARRNKAALTVAAVLAAALVLAVAVLAVSNFWVAAALAKESSALARANRQEKLATESAAEAKRQERLALRRFYAAQMNLAQQAWDAGNPSRVLELLENQRPRDGDEDLRTFEWYYLWRLCHTNLRLTLRAPEPGFEVAYSPDGRTIAASGSGGTVTLWDATTGRELRRLQGHRGSGHMVFSRDGKTLVQAGGTTSNVNTVWDLATARPRTLEGTRWERGLAFSPDGKTLATGGTVVRFWDVASWQVWTTLRPQPPEVLWLAFSPRGETLATASGWPESGGGVELWDLTRNPPEVVRRLPWGYSLAFGPDGKSLATKTPSGVYLWDVSTGRELAKFDLGVTHGLGIAFSGDGKRLAFASGNRTWTLWEPATGHTRTFAHLQQVESVAFSPDGQAIASLSSDGIVKVWDLAPIPEPLVLRHTAGVTSVAYSPDSKKVAATAADGTVKLWEVETGRELETFRGPAALMASSAFSPDGTVLASACGTWGGNEPGAVKLWDLTKGRELATLRGHIEPIWCVAYAPGGRHLASGGKDGTVRLWDATTAQTLRTMPLPARCRAMALSPDGGSLAAGGHYGSVLIYDVMTGHPKGVIRHRLGNLLSISSIAYSRGGELLATGDEQGGVRLWDPVTLQVRASLSGHTDPISSMSFFPDGRTLAIGDAPTVVSPGPGGTVRLWDVESGQERITLRGGGCVAASPDGKTLAVGGGDGSVKVFRAETGPDALERKTELVPSQPRTEEMDAGQFNGLAWSLVRDRRLSVLEPAHAVRLARKAVELAPQDGNSRNTLGVALYRAGDWQAAIDELTWSMKLQNGGDSTDWFFLAMAHRQLGHGEEAREWYERAVQWMDQHAPQNGNLHRFRAEAEELLQIDKTKD